MLAPEAAQQPRPEVLLAHQRDRVELRGRRHVEALLDRDQDDDHLRGASRRAAARRRSRSVRACSRRAGRGRAASRPTASRPSSPLHASPIDSNPGVASITSRATPRKSAWSSTVRTRTLRVAEGCGPIVIGRCSTWAASVGSAVPVEQWRLPAYEGGACFLIASRAIRWCAIRMLRPRSARLSRGRHERSLARLACARSAWDDATGLVTKGAGMTQNGHMGREVLPIPDRAYAGLVTYDAKDPDTSFPPITPLRPPDGAPNVLVVLLDDVGFGAGSAFGGPCATPTAERLGGGRPEVQPLPHDGAVLADAAGAADRAQPSLGRHGRHHRDRHVGARLQLDPAEHRGAARRDAQAERLLDGAVRQVPRGPGVGDEPDRAVRPLADRRRRLRALLRLHRRRGPPVLPGALRGHRSRSSRRRRPRRATTSRRT